ncbi:MAG: ATP-binding protein [Sulfuricella sp.]|nr:ATP-binding protein [Sulfuricella sp.]
MSLFENLPIKRKLMFIGLVTNGVAVVLLSITLGVGEWASYRGRAVNTLAVHAGVIADNAAPALMFLDEKAAHEVLARLGIETTIVYAALQGKSGGIVAQFHLPGQRRLATPLPAPGEHVFYGDQLVLAQSVIHSGEIVGTLYLQSNLRDVYWELLRKLSLIVVAMTASLAFALFLFTRFQKAISDPIQNLVEAMMRVTRENDYSAQALVQSRDEFGVLAQGFNVMLGAIREREAALTAYQAGLEDAVRERTEELKQLNETLEQRVQDEGIKNREKDHMLIRQSRLAAMGEMIGNIAHQWRQPLNALSLLLANIKDAYEFNELDRAYLDDSVAKGGQLIQKMSSTIDDFRNFFKPDREKQPFSLEKAVRDALSVVEASFRSGNIAVELKMERDATAMGFPNEYAQVVANILGNARDAIRERQVRDGKVEIVIGADDAYAYVAIRDNGGGIPEDVVEKIFDPYFTTREKGTGIGLYMSKMIIETNMNGRIEARNTGEGAEFRIVVPLATGNG